MLSAISRAPSSSPLASAAGMERAPRVPARAPARGPSRRQYRRRRRRGRRTPARRGRPRRRWRGTAGAAPAVPRSSPTHLEGLQLLAQAGGARADGVKHRLELAVERVGALQHVCRRGRGDLLDVLARLLAGLAAGGLGGLAGVLDLAGLEPASRSMSAALLLGGLDDQPDLFEAVLASESVRVERDAERRRASTSSASTLPDARRRRRARSPVSRWGSRASRLTDGQGPLFSPDCFLERAEDMASG